MLDAGLHAVAGVVDLLPDMQRRMAAVRLIEDLAYAQHGGEVLRLDVLRPATPGPHPVIVYMHGGAFAIGSKRTHRALAAAYASRGYLVCNIDYRLASVSGRARRRLCRLGVGRRARGRVRRRPPTYGAGG